MMMTEQGRAEECGEYYRGPTADECQEYTDFDLVTEDRERLWLALLSNLDWNCTVLLYLRYVKGLKFQEVGDLFGYSKERARQIELWTRREIQRRLVARTSFNELIEGL